MLTPKRLSAIVPSTDIHATKKFLVETLQFEDIPMHTPSPDYAIARTADTELHLQTAQGPPNTMSLYLLVEDVESFWDTLKDKQETLQLRAPFIQDYGMKELHLILPCTNALMIIGEDLG